MSGELERRPAPGRATGDVRFPPEWIERYGRPPVDLAEREAWIVNAIEGGVPTRTPEQRTRDLIAEADALLARECDDDGLQIRRATTSRVAARSAKVSVGGKPGTTTVAGVAVPWMGRSSWLGFFEQFDPDAFSEQAAQGFVEVAGFVAHDRRNALALIGTVQGGTMSLERRSDGLHFGVELPTSGIGPYVAEMVRRGDLGGASVGFKELDGTWTLTSQRKPLRTVTRALLGEVSIVHRGAYPQAKIAARSVPDLTPAEFMRRIERGEREQAALGERLLHRTRFVRVGGRHVAIDAHAKRSGAK